VTRTLTLSASRDGGGGGGRDVHTALLQLQFLLCASRNRIGVLAVVPGCIPQKRETEAVFGTLNDLIT
jgi:hypothetical protein